MPLSALLPLEEFLLALSPAPSPVSMECLCITQWSVLAPASFPPQLVQDSSAWSS